MAWLEGPGELPSHAISDVWNTVGSIPFFSYRTPRSIWSGWWFQTFFIFHKIWDNPSHWRSYFSRWLLHHQPVMVESRRSSFSAPDLPNKTNPMNLWIFKHFRAIYIPWNSDTALNSYRCYSPTNSGGHGVTTPATSWWTIVTWVFFASAATGHSRWFCWMQENGDSNHRKPYDSHDFPIFTARISEFVAGPKIPQVYQGRLSRFGQEVWKCPCGNGWLPGFRAGGFLMGGLYTPETSRNHSLHGFIWFYIWFNRDNSGMFLWDDKNPIVSTHSCNWLRKPHASDIIYYMYVSYNQL